MDINNEQYLEQIKKEIEALHEKKIQIEQTIKKEKEEAEKRKKEEKEKELTAIKNAIKAFNEKHDDTLCLGIKRNSDVGKDLFDTLFPWWGD